MFFLWKNKMFKLILHFIQNRLLYLNEKKNKLEMAVVVSFLFDPSQIKAVKIVYYD